MIQIYASCVGYLELDRASAPGAGSPGGSVTNRTMLHTQETLRCETGA
jgi:hypothetical protein